VLPPARYVLITRSIGGSRRLPILGRKERFDQFTDLHLEVRRYWRWMIP
jgi:hypothetical protein